MILVAAGYCGTAFSAVSQSSPGPRGVFRQPVLHESVSHVRSSIVFETLKSVKEVPLVG
jgi:hypothetical protein